MKIIFTLEFNVDVGRGAYRSFIEGLRNQLAGDRVSHDRHVLPRQAQPPTEWFELALRTNQPHEIRLLFRRDNLYLDAYRMENSERWLEFSTPNALVPDSDPLGFDGSYIDSNGLESAAGRTRENIRLCRVSLRNAVNHLATSGDRRVRAESLLVVIQMFSESVRFEEITYFLLENYIAGDPGRVPDERILLLENRWGRISNALLRSDAHPDLPISPLGFPEHLRLNSAPEVAAAIGILLFNVKGILPRAPRSLLAGMDLGRPLVEVFAVQINNIDKEKVGDFYGTVIVTKQRALTCINYIPTVTVTDRLISQYIYNRERGNYESVKEDGYALLTGPAARAILALDSFTIDVALMDRDSFPDLSPDDEVSKGQIAWNIYHTNNIYDKPLSQEISGKYGSATVVYGVFSDAMQATIEVKLIKGDGESPADVYGLLAASNSKFTGNNESELFRVTKESGVSVEVEPKKLIPLSRSILAVPLNSDLRVRALLYDRDSFPDISSDDGIANDTASFPAQLSGTSQQNIFGKYGEIQVKVTWTP